jgi:hypothetical protein
MAQYEEFCCQVCGFYTDFNENPPELEGFTL